MKITRLGQATPLLSATSLGGSGGTLDPVVGGGLVPVASGSNSWSWGSNVSQIFANGSNAVLGPSVNFAAGTNITLAVSSNTLTITSAAGGGSTSYGSNSNSVASANDGGASTLASRADHVHLGVRSLAHSSNSFSGPVILTASGTLGITSPTPGTYNLSAGTGGGGGGGGVTHAYVGYNTVGGTAEDAIANRQIAKSITLASAGTLISVAAYVQVDIGPDTAGFGVGVWTNSAGTVGNLIAANVPRGAGSAGSPGASLALVATTPRWIDIAMGIYLAAGTYWIGIIAIANGFGGNRLNVYYDGSGTDRRFDSGDAYIQDGGVAAQTDTTRKYSIRASVLT